MVTVMYKSLMSGAGSLMGVIAKKHNKTESGSNGGHDGSGDMGPEDGADQMWGQNAAMEGDLWPCPEGQPLEGIMEEPEPQP